MFFLLEKHQKKHKKASKRAPLNSIDRTAELRESALLCTFPWILMLFGAIWCFCHFPPAAPRVRHGTEVILVLFWCFFGAFLVLPLHSEPDLNAMISNLRRDPNSCRAGTALQESGHNQRCPNTEVQKGAFWCFFL